MTSARDRDYQRKLIAQIKYLTRCLHQRHWTPQEVEEETLRGYDEPWRTDYDEIVARKAAIKLARATVMADWQIERLNAWNRAIVLGGEHYEEWRKAYIEPMQQRINSHTLWRHQISRVAAKEALPKCPIGSRACVRARS